MSKVPIFLMDLEGINGDIKFPDGWLGPHNETSEYLWRLDVMRDWMGVLTDAYYKMGLEWRVGLERQRLMLEVAEKVSNVLGEPVETAFLRHCPEGTKQ